MAPGEKPCSTGDPRPRRSALGHGGPGLPPGTRSVARAAPGAAATFCVTGIQEGEAVALGMGSLEGNAGSTTPARRLQVVGKGNKTRAIRRRAVPAKDSPDSRRVTLESPRFSRVGLRPGELGCPPGAELGHRC